jgi:hypothetical protein
MFAPANIVDNFAVSEGAGADPGRLWARLQIANRQTIIRQNGLK